MTTSATLRNDLLTAAAQELSLNDYSDYCVNGMQVEGAEAVTHITSAVSCSTEVFQRAVELKSTFLIVHHGLFWKGSEPGSITGRTRARLKLLFDAEITLATYHLPLDGHPRLGNNAIIAERLGAIPDRRTPFALNNQQSVGCIADLAAPLSSSELGAKVSQLCNQPATVIGATLDGISRVAICSGGGASYLDEAHSAGAQALITGEARENTMADAAELGITVIAGGHWATETFGVQALGSMLASQFGLEHTFIEAPNPI
jgi:dinuclear metal center YbgI/SA1388 family protein